MIMSVTGASAQNGKAKTEKKTFSRTTSISQVIEADASVIWTLLTRAEDYSRWNSTIVSIEGSIEPKSKIKLKTTLAPNRTFKLKVKEIQAESKLVWGDAMGTRVYLLQRVENGVLFSMTERIGSFMFPLFANQIPSFDASFEQFTEDLKKEAEAINN